MAPPSCVSLVFHTPGSEGLGLEVFSALQDMVIVHDTLEVIGESSLAFGDFEVSADPLDFGVFGGDPVPTIHIDFGEDNTDNAFSGKVLRDFGDCRIREAHLRLNKDEAWAWGIPENNGATYYGLDDTYWAMPSFRDVYLHEMLHAVGLEHNPSKLSMLNAGSNPWINRSGDDALVALPDDVRGLRALYPADWPPRFDVALLNRWNTTIIQEDNNAVQSWTCLPSRGEQAADWMDFPRDDGIETCGSRDGGDGEQTVCAGSDLYASVAIANYGTDAVDIKLQLWFSEDNVFDRNVDAKSPSVYTDIAPIGDADARRLERVFEVPSGLSLTEHYVIARVIATEHGTGNKVREWIPLRGTVDVAGNLACATREILVP